MNQRKLLALTIVMLLLLSDLTGCGKTSAVLKLQIQDINGLSTTTESDSLPVTIALYDRSEEAYESPAIINGVTEDDFKISFSVTSSDENTHVSEVSDGLRIETNESITWNTSKVKRVGNIYTFSVELPKSENSYTAVYTITIKRLNNSKKDQYEYRYFALRVNP